MKEVKMKHVELLANVSRDLYDSRYDINEVLKDFPNDTELKTIQESITQLKLEVRLCLWKYSALEADVEVHDNE